MSSNEQPLSLEGFYRKYGVSLEVHYGPGRHNGCRGLLDGHESHSIGCSGEERADEDLKDRAGKVSFVEGDPHRVGTVTVKFPAERDYDQTVINDEDIGTLDVIDMEGWRFVIREDGNPFAGAPLALAQAVVAFEDNKLRVVTCLLQAQAECSKAMFAAKLMDPELSPSQVERIGHAKDDLEQMRVDVCQLRKEAL